jgi:hypothetical protein
MAQVRITFVYEPEEADSSDRTGVAESEFIRVHDLLGEHFGADDITIERVEESA